MRVIMIMIICLLFLTGCVSSLSGLPLEEIDLSHVYINIETPDVVWKICQGHRGCVLHYKQNGADCFMIYASDESILKHELGHVREYQATGKMLHDINKLKNWERPW